MKILQKNIKIFIYYFFVIIFFSSCSSRYVKSVIPEVKTEFGITLTAPSQGVFFVENEKVVGSKDKIDIHSTTANLIYNIYGPAVDKRFVGRTNALQLKFNIKDKTYLIDITKFKKRTAMVMFDGERKPIIVFNPAKYEQKFLKYYYYEKPTK